MPTELQTDHKRLRMRRHLRFVFEALLVLVLFAGLWLVLQGPETYFELGRFGLRGSTAFRLYLLMSIGFIFLLVIYYGTSFEVTPLTMISRPVGKFAKIRELNSVQPSTFPDEKNGDDLDPGESIEVANKEEVANKDLDEPEESSDETSDTVQRVLRRSSHSASHLARKMERRINTHLILGVLIGLVGLVVWYYSFFITPGSGTKSAGTGAAVIVAWDLIPRVTILLFIELLAGFFLRQYRIGVEDFKYFLELQRRAEASRVAYAIFEQLGDTESKRKFATTLLEARSDIRLQNDETTTILETMKSEENTTLKLISVLGDHLESVTKLLRKDKEK